MKYSRLPSVCLGFVPPQAMPLALYPPVFRRMLRLGPVAVARCRGFHHSTSLRELEIPGVPLDYKVPPTLYDPSWDRLPPQDDESKSRRMLQDTQTRKDWTIRLEFKCNGAPSLGTGFFLSIPILRNFHVILTAGHNLLKDNKECTDLVLKLPGQQDPAAPGGAVGNDFTPSPEQRFVSSRYLNGKATAASDFGAILVPKPVYPEQTSIGFGFAMELTTRRSLLRGKMLKICGYTGSDMKEQPEDSEGQCLTSGDSELEYDVETIPGLSGSPIFTPYRDSDTVVGIHNNGPARKGGGSRGALLNEEVMREVFGWIQSAEKKQDNPDAVIYLGKKLRAAPGKKKVQSPPKEGIFLRFLPDEPKAWTRRGDDGLDTNFDVFPVCSDLKQGRLFHAFRFIYPAGWPHSGPEKKHAWVVFDTIRDRLSLSEELLEQCNVRLVPSGKDAFYVVVDRGADKGLAELKLDSALLEDDEIELGERDSPEVSVTDMHGGRWRKFNLFSLVD